jgi:hypothetical protein
MKLSARNQLKGKITEVKKSATTTQNVSAGPPRRWRVTIRNIHGSWPPATMPNKSPLNY